MNIILDEQFYDWLDMFEHYILTIPELWKTHRITTRNNRKFENFGKILGTAFYSPEILTIDYLGYLKKSTGFFKYIKQTNENPRMIQGKILYFQSVKIEHFIKFPPELTSNFWNFKKTLLKIRGFK